MEYPDCILKSIWLCTRQDLLLFFINYIVFHYTFILVYFSHLPSPITLSCSLPTPVFVYIHVCELCLCVMFVSVGGSHWTSLELLTGSRVPFPGYLTEENGKTDFWSSFLISVVTEHAFSECCRVKQDTHKACCLTPSAHISFPRFPPSEAPLANLESVSKRLNLKNKEGRHTPMYQ